MIIYGIIINHYGDDPAYMGDEESDSHWQELYPKLYTEKRRADNAARSLQKVADKERLWWQERYYTVTEFDIAVSLIDIKNCYSHHSPGDSAAS